MCSKFEKEVIIEQLTRSYQLRSLHHQLELYVNCLQNIFITLLLQMIN